MTVSDWMPLYLSDNHAGTPWLFQFHPYRGGFKLQLTDLNGVWEERIPVKVLKQRAQRFECPIDPSQDQNQLQNLTDRLERMLLDNAAGLSSSIRKNDDATAVYIDVECELPRPLRPLKWTFETKLQDQGSIKYSVVQPLVDKVNMQTSQLGQLTRLLHEKDNAILSILEKLESSELDLTSIFPMAASWRPGTKVSRKEQLRTSIKGLKVFEADEFFREKTMLDDEISQTQRLTIAFQGVESLIENKSVLGTVEVDRPARWHNAEHGVTRSPSRRQSSDDNEVCVSSNEVIEYKSHEDLSAQAGNIYRREVGWP